MARRQNDSAHPPEVRPVDVDGVRTVAIVTVGWGVAFVVLALRQGQLNDAGNGWWLWTCLAGVGLGLLGLEYCRKRRDAIAQAALDAEAGSGEFEDESAVGDWSRLPPEEPNFGVDEQSLNDDQAAPADGDHVTQPYQHVEQPPGYSTGDMPVVPGQTGQPVAGYPGTAAYGQSPQPDYAEPHTPPPPPRSEPPPSEPAAPRHYESAPQRPVERPRPQPAPPPAPAPAPAPQQQPSMPTEAVPPRPAAQRPAPPQRAPQPPVQQAPQAPQPPPSPPQQAPSPQPEPAPQDPYSTGADWYDSAAGYTPEADRARRHPRDRRPETPQPSAEPPPAGRERQGRRPLEDSEFFGDESSAPPPNSTAEFLLADLEDDDDEQAPPARHDRDAPDDEYRGRRTRRSR